jgi:hypothetical protein
MTNPTRLQGADRMFAILHTVLVAGVAMILVAFGIVRSVVTLDPMSGLVPTFRIVAVALLVGGYLVMRVLRAGIPPLGSDGDRTAWWTEYGRRALMLWVVAEGVAMAGGVFWFLTGDWVVLAGVAGVALGLMVMNRPARLVEP